MPVIISLAIFGISGVINPFNTCSKNAPVHDKTEMDNMLSQMVGKSKREARKIVRMYRK